MTCVHVHVHVQYNLEYPDFYTKLYALFTVEVLFVKYKVTYIFSSFYLLQKRFTFLTDIVWIFL